MEPQFRKITTRAYKRLNPLRRISSLAKEPNPNILAHLYKSVIMPIFAYCVINAAEAHMEEFQLLQNMALRETMNSLRYISIKDLHDCTVHRVYYIRKAETGNHA